MIIYKLNQLFNEYLNKISRMLKKINKLYWKLACHWTKCTWKSVCHCTNHFFFALFILKLFYLSFESLGIIFDRKFYLSYYFLMCLLFSWHIIPVFLHVFFKNKFQFRKWRYNRYSATGTVLVCKRPHLYSAQALLYFFFWKVLVVAVQKALL